MSRLRPYTTDPRERRAGGLAAPIGMPLRAERGYLLSELESLLREPGCPVCRHVEEAERSFFSWFEIESFCTAEVQAQLRAAMGMCAVHTRRTIEQIGEGHIMTTVARQAVAGARACVGGEVAPGCCPACEAAAGSTERAIGLVLDGLADRGHARLYAECSGMCRLHLIRATPIAEPATLKLIVERLRDSLDEAESIELVGLLTGVDRDGSRRRRWRQHLPDQPVASSTVDGLCERLAIDACPVCLAIGSSEREYVGWFLARGREQDPSIRTDPGELCSIHLSDTALADRDVAADAAVRARERGREELQRLLAKLPLRSSQARRQRRNHRGELEGPKARFTAERHCPACHARGQIERRQLALLSALIALAPVRERYVHGHGLCVYHVLALGAGELARLARRRADARLAVLGWELDETARKYAWACRHEPSGPERDAWLRALGQVDGRVFEGCPAPSGSAQHDA